MESGMGSGMGMGKGEEGWGRERGSGHLSGVAVELTREPSGPIETAPDRGPFQPDSRLVSSESVSREEQTDMTNGATGTNETNEAYRHSRVGMVTTDRQNPLGHGIVPARAGAKHADCQCRPVAWATGGGSI
ncbi:unnamed protein product [Protopolystoma xenopodis]|uniref:Uncharacterized protein n=1 Tax=Protopolystoma xenopodis TaxID=117903 RepID=A0A3S5CR27_9PLAT|nr:unnamed protein product [Protopolystoma xenopodis]